MPHARTVTFTHAPVALRVRCRTTTEQNRTMYLAGRPAWEAQLAMEWRVRQSTCDRCGERGGEHTACGARTLMVVVDDAIRPATAAPEDEGDAVTALGNVRAP